MTLTELADFVTTKLSDTDTSSVSVCKDFINRRYQMIWDSGLWTETMGVASKAVAAEDTEITIDSAPSITFYQSSSAPSTKVDFPVALRFTETGKDQGLNILNDSWMTFFQIDPNAWENIANRRANPSNFINLPKDGSGNCRIKPVPVPKSAGTLFVLGKLNWVALGDTDTPALNGIDNALLAFAEGDMLERARQYQKAQVKFTEAASHVQIMRDLEKGQEQNISRIIPYTYNDYDFHGSVAEFGPKN
tara:strand:- start:323 stop:1066 length:744 start_codon:yes stop_codon:yes gene_type:complete